MLFKAGVVGVLEDLWEFTSDKVSQKASRLGARLAMGCKAAAEALREGAAMQAPACLLRAAGSAELQLAGAKRLTQVRYPLITPSTRAPAPARGRSKATTRSCAVISLCLLRADGFYGERRRVLRLLHRGGRPVGVGARAALHPRRREPARRVLSEAPLGAQRMRFQATAA